MTAPYIESGDLVVIGLVQEQHPQRAMLYAQWRRIDWPILWDPFNTTRAAAVPNAYLIDEHGVLQGKQLNAPTLKAFMSAVYQAPAQAAAISADAERLAAEDDHRVDADDDQITRLSDLTWRRFKNKNDLSVLVNRQTQWTHREDAEAIDWFRLGVALRMRYDSNEREPGDFQAAIDAWANALKSEPNQYIWRRRIQQYGPMTDKPYPFYDWVETAQHEVMQRGQTPVEIPEPLTQAELATRRSRFALDSEPVDPDPQGLIARDDDAVITITSAVARDTRRPGSARVLLELRPALSEVQSEGGFGGGSGGGGAHWNNEAEPLMIWIDGGAVPTGWKVESPLLVHVNAQEASSTEPRGIDFGLTYPADAVGAHRLTGYALYNICQEGDLGRCLYLRQDFEVNIELD